MTTRWPPGLALHCSTAAGPNGGEKQSLRELISAIRTDGITVVPVEHDLRLVMISRAIDQAGVIATSSGILSYWPHQPFHSWVLGRVLAEAGYGGSEAHEVLRIAGDIRPGDADSWYDGFRGLADRAAADGEAAAGRGRATTACAHFLRAIGYYRWCEFFLAPEDPRRAEVFPRAIACFRLALRPERIDHPYPGYFLRAAGVERGPAAFYLNGIDVLKEELYFLGGAALLARGVHLIVFDGPGQGETLRHRGITARPDAEVAVSAMLDGLLERPEVDGDRVGLCGRSFGGYLAGRALAFEPRLTAGVIFGALYDAREVFDASPDLRAHFRWILGAQDDEHARDQLRPFTLAGCLSRVECPTLVLHGADDMLVPPSHAERTLSELGGPKESLLFPSGRPGADHCQHTAFPEAICAWTDWLAEHLRTA